MEIKSLASILLLFIANFCYSQANIPVIRANSHKVAIRDYDKLTKNAWLISPKEKLDIYTTSGKSVTFYTDIDSINFTIDPKISEYNFDIILNEKDTAHTQIKYDASYSPPLVPTAEDVRKMIEGQIYALKIAPETVYKIVNKSVWNGSDSIKIRIYYPNANKKQRIIYNIHGGAFVTCNLDTHDNICRILANKAQSIVIALDYRKPPESPFPASLDDCATVLKWIKTNAKILGGDSNNLVLIGDSGGGLLVTALEVKLQKKLNAKAIVLVNPIVDLRGDEPGPYTMVINWYLSDKDPNDSLISPITAKNLSFFPPALIITSEKDDLKPQGIALFNKLSEQGVITKTVDIPQQGHLGPLWAAGHSYADKAIDETVKFILAESK